MEIKEDFVVEFREPRVSDVSELHQLIIDSTGGKTKVTISSLYDDLFGSTPEITPPEVGAEDPCFEFDVKLINSNRNVLQAYLAEFKSRIIGFVLFHYHYSPWEGHSAFVDNIYTCSKYRRKGVARELINKVNERCKKENVHALFFRTRDLEPELLARIHECKPRWYRNNQYDWSVCRIYF